MLQREGRLEREEEKEEQDMEGVWFVTGVTNLATLRVNVGTLPPMIGGGPVADMMMTRRGRRRTNNCAPCNVSGILFNGLLGLANFCLLP